MRARRHTRKKIRARRCTQKDGRGLKGALEGGEGSKAHSKENEGSKAHSKGWSRAWRCTRKKMRARRRIQKDCRGIKDAIEEGEGSKAHSKGGRVRKRTTLGMRNERWWKNTKICFLPPDSHRQPAQVKISHRWKIFKSNFNLGHFKVAFRLIDLDRDFSCEVCKTHCPMSQSLDDMHASLSDLKYRPPFLLNLLVCLIDDD